MSDALFDRVAAEMSENAGTDRGKLFGHPALKVAGRVFACGFDGDLVVKIGADRVQELAAAGQATPFDPRGSGSPMGGWAQVPAPEDGEDVVVWLDLVAEAHAYTAGQSD